MMILLIQAAIMFTAFGSSAADRRLEVALDRSGGLPVAELISVLARASGVSVDRPAVNLTLPTRGLAGSLTRTLLSECVGTAVDFHFGRDAVTVVVDGSALGEEHRAEWKRLLDDLSERSRQAAQRQQYYGMKAHATYRPNDPGRPTVCLVHGLNSSSGGFVHMFDELEDAGYGLVVFDYPFNQRLEDSCAQFRDAWMAFRKEAGETRPWAILAHSMGALVARSYVERDHRAGNDVASLILIAPVNQGAHVARIQPVYQTIASLFAINSRRTEHALSQLSDGIGQAAEDLLPGSAFLRRINARPRAANVPYHILAGNSGLISREIRQQARAQLDAAARDAGFLGIFTQFAGREVGPLLDEISDGTGDGCVAVEKTRLAGVDDHTVIGANHAELIRAPLLFLEDGPVPCMPYVLRWLQADLKRTAR